jgi:hypothetical protein
MLFQEIYLMEKSQLLANRLFSSTALASPENQKIAQQLHSKTECTPLMPSEALRSHLGHIRDA